MNKVLLFDFDGTLADSFENFMSIIGILAEKHKFEKLSREELESLRSEDARTLMKRLKIPFYKIPFIGMDMKKLQQEHIAKIKPFDGLPEVLKELKDKGYTLGIVTSNGKENVELFTKKNNIDVFSFIYSDTSMFGKDKVLRKFMKQHKVKSEDILYVGDEIRDIQACKKVGIQMIAVTWGFTTKEGLKKHNPDFLIDTPKDLLKVTAEI